MEQKTLNDADFITVTTNPEADGVEGYYEFMPDIEKLSPKSKYKFDSHNERFRIRYGGYPKKIIPEFGRIENVRLISV